MLENIGKRLPVYCHLTHMYVIRIVRRLRFIGFILWEFMATFIQAFFCNRVFKFTLVHTIIFTFKIKFILYNLVISNMIRFLFKNKILILIQRMMEFFLDNKNSSVLWSSFWRPYFATRCQEIKYSAIWCQLPKIHCHIAWCWACAVYVQIRWSLPDTCNCSSSFYCVCQCVKRVFG